MSAIDDDGPNDDEDNEDQDEDDGQVGEDETRGRQVCCPVFGRSCSSLFSVSCKDFRVGLTAPGRFRDGGPTSEV